MEGMNEKLKKLEKFVEPKGWVIDTVSQGYENKIFYRNILENYELIVDLRFNSYDIHLHRDIFLTGFIKKLIDDLKFAEKIAKKTIKLCGNREVK